MTGGARDVQEAAAVTMSVQEATAVSLSLQFGFAPDEIAFALDISRQEADAALERAEVALT